MFTFASLSRCAGMLCRIAAGVLALSPAAFAEASKPPICDAAWHATAEGRADEGLALEQGYGVASRVVLWRLLMLGEGEPGQLGEPETYGYNPRPFLTLHFPNDPDVARILGLLDAGELPEAITAIEVLTQIPDPRATDIATERRLVRSELLFAGVLWTARWDNGAGAPALKWMALLNTHFLALPLSILNHDIAVNGAYWRALDDFDWFNGRWTTLQGQDVEDWWLPNTQASLGAAAGLAEATRQSPLFDWLEAMETTADLTASPWLDYLTPRFSTPAYANVYGHLIEMRAQDWSLPWQIALARRWAPGLESLGAPAMGAYAQQQDRLAELERRATTCALTPAEQYALGPLRFHAVRYRALKLQDPERGAVFWRAEIDPADPAAASDHTRQEIVRFALSTGQSAVADAFQRARDPKAPYRDSSLATELDALTAPDLAHFAAADPDPAVLNLLPVRTLAELIALPGLRRDLRAAAARMAWTRAYLLDETAILERITPLLAETNPDLKPLLDTYRDAWTDSGRHLAGLDLLLKAPGMQLVLPADGLFWGVDRVRIWSDKAEDWKDAVLKSDHLNPNDGNWWCRFDLDRQLSSMKLYFYDLPLRIPYDKLSPRNVDQVTAFRDSVLRMHPILQQIDYEELGRLAKLPNAPTYLARSATDWARSSWWWERYFAGDRMADALSRSIRATRWGCHRDGSNAAASNAAWRVLQEMFPDSAAAKNTPYWYN